MTQSDRQKKILEMLATDEMVKASDLISKFNVSSETIRRDLEELEKEGLLRRVYGGAVQGSIFGTEPAYNSRQVINQAKKQIIASEVTKTLSNKDTIFMDGGTTMFEVARAISKSSLRDLVVITNAINIADEIVENSDYHVILLGGTVNRGEQLTTGFICENNLNYFHANKVFLGAAGISKENGITDFSVDSSSAKRIMIKRADCIVCVADSSKFGKTANNCICSFNQLNVLITDDGIPKEAEDLCRSTNVKLIVASD